MLLSRYLLICLLFFISSSVFAVDYSLPNNQWRMISLPANPGASNTVEAIFADDIKAEYGTAWVLYTYHPELKGYGSPLGLNSRLTQGTGYWIIQKTGVTVSLDMPESSTVTQEGLLTSLVSSSGTGPQWNFMGNPLSNAVDVQSIRIKTQAGACAGRGCDLNKAKSENLIENRLWIYNGVNHEYINTDSLGAWDAYWLAALGGSQGHSLSLSYSHETSTSMGARETSATPLAKGTLFASPSGKGDGCKNEAPCAIRTAFNRLKAGDVLFLKGGTYFISGSPLTPKRSGEKGKRIIIESYPGELAVLEGEFKTLNDLNANPKGRTHGVSLMGRNYITVRKIEARYMGWSGFAATYSSNNIVEGCHAHHNFSAGIAVYGGTWKENDPDYVIPYKYGYNIVRDNIVHDNSDVGLPANGGNADGIGISSGRHNRVEHNTVYANSDDGIDTWRSNDSYVAFNLSFDNGRANGDGNGIKAGGNTNKNAGNGRRTVVEHNIAYNNHARGFDYNVGRDVIFRYNTSYNNKTIGFTGSNDTLMEYNIAAKNGTNVSTLGSQSNNSWQVGGAIRFISTDPNSNNFLRPAIGSVFESMGAYSHQ
jgi:hypothetical protein